jgi:hypothetical protein
LIALACHPAHPSRAVRHIGVEVRRDAGILQLRYLIEGRIEELRLPARGAQPLWRHTCCEAFVARPGARAYHELNFSPSGDWAAYAFTDYRQGRPTQITDPRIALTESAGALELRASVRIPDGPVLLGLSAVMQECDGRLSYWALRHAPGKPDFHHRDAFALELA